MSLLNFTHCIDRHYFIDLLSCDRHCDVHSKDGLVFWGSKAVVLEKAIRIWIGEEKDRHS